MVAAFADPKTYDERAVKALIDQFNATQTIKLEQDLFKQKKRLVEAQRTLKVKTTKAATESARIAQNKVDWCLGKLDDLRRTELEDKDSRIFPGWYAPVMAWENGQRCLRPMRYQCRPAGKPASYDAQYPGTYNARRDNLTAFWKGQFGHTHGIIVASAFYENVSRHRIEGRELAAGEKDENVILQFKPRPRQDMLIACLWSHWKGKNESDLLSFAAITDEPPAEVAAAGHDRCIIPIRRESVDEWLNPDAQNMLTLEAILDDRERPYYEHRMAA